MPTPARLRKRPGNDGTAMKKYLLMPSRRNQALEEISKAGLNPVDFEWTEAHEERVPTVADAGIISVLVHRPTGYSFSFDLRGQLFSVRFSPGQDAPQRIEICVSLPQVMSFFIFEWLPSLKREFEAPDLWEELRKDNMLLRLALVGSTTESLNPSERSQVISGLKSIKRWLLDARELDEAEHALVVQRLDYLESAVDRLPRGDWIHTAIGVFFTIAVGIGLAPDQARHLFQMLGDVLNTLTDGLSRLLQF